MPRVALWCRPLIIWDVASSSARQDNLLSTNCSTRSPTEVPAALSSSRFSWCNNRRRRRHAVTQQRTIEGACDTLGWNTGRTLGSSRHLARPVHIDSEAQRPERYQQLNEKLEYTGLGVRIRPGRRCTYSRGATAAQVCIASAPLFTSH